MSGETRICRGRIRYVKLFPAAAFLTVLSLSLHAETVRIVFYQLEPFQMLRNSDGKPVGVTLDYWRTFLAPGMGVDLEISGPFPVARAQKMVENGEADVVTHLTKIPDREARFLFPVTKLTDIQSCLTVRPDHPLTEIRRQEDVLGMTIGFLTDAWIPPMLLHDRIHIELVFNEDYRQVNLRKLLAGRLDAVLDINYESMSYYLKLRGYEGKVRTLLLPVEKVPVYSVFRKSEKGRRLSLIYDKVNGEGLAAGLFERLKRDYLK